MTFDIYMVITWSIFLGRESFLIRINEIKTISNYTFRISKIFSDEF